MQKKVNNKKYITSGGIEPGTTGITRPHTTTTPRQPLHNEKLQLSM